MGRVEKKKKEKLARTESMHERRKVKKLRKQIPGEGWLHNPVYQVQRVKWKSSSFVWLAVEVAAVNEEEEPEYLSLDLWSQQLKLVICSSGTAWCVACVCGGSVFPALVPSHHMMVNFCQWETQFSLPKFAFPVSHYIRPAQSFHPDYLSATWHMLEKANNPQKVTL